VKDRTTTVTDVRPDDSRAGLRPGARLGIDVGTVRIGVAGCDPAAVLAVPLETVLRRGGADLSRLAALAREHAAVEVVVGLPLSLSGARGPAAVSALAYARELAAAIAPVRVRIVDERWSTVSAHGQLRAAGIGSRARRNVVDEAAAVIILQGALDTERSTGRPPGEIVDQV
jgi:putative Holliday junction resolvase